MIDYRTNKDSKSVFINPYTSKSDTSVGVYDGIVIHYGRELSDSEVETIERKLADSEKNRELMEKYQEGQNQKEE